MNVFPEAKRQRRAASAVICEQSASRLSHELLQKQKREAVPVKALVSGKVG